jgi:hypothetical protein
MAEGEKFIELVLFPQISDTVKQGKGTETICLGPGPSHLPEAWAEQKELSLSFCICKMVMTTAEPMLQFLGHRKCPSSVSIRGPRCEGQGCRAAEEVQQFPS